MEDFDNVSRAEDMLTLKELVEQLPPDLQEEARDFIEFLLTRRGKQQRAMPKFDWAGTLSDLRDQYTSVELQHKISEWRIGGK